jgi:hypothetical protein
MSETKLALQYVAPVLPAQHIGDTVAFYAQKMGFEVRYQDESYAIVVRSGVQLNFWQCDDRYIADNTACYVYVQGIEALYAAYQAQGIIHPNGALEAKPWGVKEFTVLDNNGCAIRFGERLAE